MLSEGIRSDKPSKIMVVKHPKRRSHRTIDRAHFCCYDRNRRQIETKITHSLTQPTLQIAIMPLLSIIATFHSICFAFPHIHSLASSCMRANEGVGKITWNELKFFQCLNDVDFIVIYLLQESKHHSILPNFLFHWKVDLYLDRPSE